MKIEILGTRAKIKPSAPGHSKHTGLLLDDRILIDVGEQEFLNRKPEAIVFTHFHPDHAFFVEEKTVFSPRTPHYGPEAHELAPGLRVIEEPFRLSGFSFTPVPVIHALRLKSFGYIGEKDGKRVFFTGDVAWIEAQHLKTLGKVDLIITEATFLNKGGRINRKGNRIFGHTGIPDLVRLLSPFTPKILFCHYGEWFYNDISKGPQLIKQLEREGVELIPARDGFEISI